MKVPHNRKQLLEFLINRWRLIVGFAALEKVYITHCQFTKDSDLPTPKVPLFMIPEACRQIEIIKRQIIEILPETNFIDYSFEAQAPLAPNDFVEMYIADHHQCISKIEETMERLQIT